MIRLCVFAILSLEIVALFHCSSPTLAGKGGSSETVNARILIIDTTVIVTSEDPAVKGFSLGAYSTAHRPYENYGYADSVADSASNFLQWNAPSQGDFCFLLKAMPTGSACFLADIALTRGMIDTIDCVCGPSHDLVGRVELEDSAAVTENYALSIYGSPFYAITDSLHRFAIHNVPAGSYTLSVRSLAKRLFISTDDYSINTGNFGATTNLRILMP
jgi:hypothetical protein